MKISGPLPSLPDRVASKALEALHLDPTDHLLLAENLACYSSHFKAEFQTELDSQQGPELLHSLKFAWAQGEHRWVDKIRRDLDQPYTDGQVQQRFEKLESRFQSEGQRLVLENLGSFPARVFVTGSLLKGRFGAHSDIDAIGISQGGYHPSTYGDVAWQLGDDKSQDFLLKSFVEAKEVDPGQSLLELYRQGLQTKGLVLSVDHGPWHIERHSFPQRSPEPQSQTGMMWSFADLP